MNNKSFNLNNFIQKNQTYTYKELFYLYNGEFIILNNLEKLTKGYKKGNFESFYYKIINNKLYLRIFCPLNLELSSFDKEVIISSQDLIKIQITHLKKIQTKTIQSNEIIPQTQDLVKVLSYYEDYELTFTTKNKISNLQDFIKNNNIFNTNQFLTDILFCKLYEIATSKKILLDYMGTVKLQYHKDNINNWLFLQSKIILDRSNHSIAS